MYCVKKSLSKNKSGAALIISMIFVLIFSALAVSLASLSGANVQLANNQRKSDSARGAAESGLDIMRYWFSHVSIPGSTPPSQIFQQVAISLQNVLATSSITNITTNYNNGSTLTIPSVTLDSAKGQSFSAILTSLPLDANTIQMDITGTYGTLTRTVRVAYNYSTRASTVFDFGVASKGPLSLSGNIELSGVNVSVEADVYIESDDPIALSITGNSQIAGDVRITNSLANVDLQGGQASIGGETVPEAYDHVFTGVPPTEFPAPNPGYFNQYLIGGDVIDSSTDTSSDATFTNAVIIAGTNPTFAGNVTLNGIIFIETPNIVRFEGSTTVTGIIIGDGDFEDNSGTNQISFLGTVDSYPVSDLPEEFGELRNDTGTFLMTPGFSLSFGGNFGTLNGAIAANGITFSGDAGGTIDGSVLNYSDNPMVLSGNSDLYFNRLEAGSIPAGFVPEIILQYDPTSYSEPII